VLSVNWFFTGWCHWPNMQLIQGDLNAANKPHAFWMGGELNARTQPNRLFMRPVGSLDTLFFTFSINNRITFLPCCTRMHNWKVFIYRYNYAHFTYLSCLELLLTLIEMTIDNVYKPSHLPTHFMSFHIWPLGAAWEFRKANSNSQRKRKVQNRQCITNM